MSDPHLYQIVCCSSMNPVNVQLTDNNGNPQSLMQTAFKDLRVANLYAETGWTFIYNINSDLVSTTTSLTGTVTQSNSKAVLQTGTTANSTAQIQSRVYSRQIQGMGLLIEMAAIFSTGIAGSSQIIGLGDSTNGLFFGYNDTSFGVMKRSDGVDSWIYQSDWNGDKLDGTGLSGVTLDTTKGNIYIIDFQWLGFGLITFGVVDPATGYVIVVHQIQYANTSTEVSMFTPNLPLKAQVSNPGTTSNITLQTPSSTVYLEGTPSQAISTPNGIYNNSASVVANTETNILSIQNKTTVSGKTNHVQVELQALSVASDGNQIVSIKIFRNATLTGTTTFTDINSTDSVMAYNTAATYTAGTGKFIAGYQLQKIDAQLYNLVDYVYTLEPGDTMTITAFSTGNTTIAVTVNWREYY